MTDNLITQLYERLIHAPEKMKDIDWSDVEKYCVSCILGRKEVFVDDDYERLIDKMLRLCRGIPSYVIAENLQSALYKLSELSGIISAMPDFAYYRNYINNGNFNEMLLKHYKEGTSVVIGDSHVNFFSGHETLEYTHIGHDMYWCRNINDLPITAIHVGPGLAYNAMRYGTTVRFLEKTEYLLGVLALNCQIMVTLGEVDLRAHVFRQVSIQNRDWRTIIDDITENYISFLKFIKERGFNAGCWGPIASQSDLVPPDQKSKYPRTGSEKERNKATEYFNQRMNELCRNEDIMYITLFDELIDEEYRTKTEYYATDGVHLGQAAMKLALPLLREKGFLDKDE